MMLNPERISFRKLDLSDLRLMHQWLNQSFVHEWYDRDKDNTLQEITDRYGPKILGEKPTHCYFALYDGEPVGYLQYYKVNDWPEFGDHIGYDDFTASVDLFIGNELFMGKGFGSIMLKKFLEEIVFDKTNNIHTCVIGPEPDNLRAIRAYEKVGFVHAKTVLIPGESVATYLMEKQKS